MLLYINTTDFDRVQFALIKKDATKEFSKVLAFNENYKTLELLEKFLKKNKVTPKQLVKIVVCSGPGSFTGIRVGVSMAMAMGFALEIPVETMAKNKVPTDLQKLLTELKTPTKSKTTKKLLLNYGQKPKITKSKKNR